MKKPYQNMNFAKFARKFSTEKSCEKYLFKMKFYEGFKCPQCNHDEYYFCKRKKLYQCKACKHQTSVTAGTIMHRSRTPLIKWFQAIFLEASDKRGISALALTKKIEVSYWVAWNMLQKIKVAMGQRDQQYLLEGLVEVDDGYIGTPTKNGKRGRGTGKQQVIVGASTNKKDAKALYYAKMTIVDHLDGEQLKTVAKDTIQVGTRVKTDSLPVNNALKEDYEHINITVKGKDASEVLKWVHILLSNVKAFLQGTYHGIAKKHLQRYLDAFCYRFNRRFWEGQLFDRLLMASVSCAPVAFAELTQ